MILIILWEILITLKKNELALIRYSPQLDVWRDIIKGSIRAQSIKQLLGNFFKKGFNPPFFG